MENGDHKQINQGWECPKCGAVYSPNTSMCSHCTPNKTSKLAEAIKNSMNVPFAHSDEKQIADYRNLMAPERSAYHIDGTLVECSEFWGGFVEAAALERFKFPIYYGILGFFYFNSQERDLSKLESCADTRYIGFMEVACQASSNPGHIHPSMRLERLATACKVLNWGSDSLCEAVEWATEAFGIIIIPVIPVIQKQLR